MLIFIVSSWSAMERKNHYAIVVDAGSSGSRAYLYHWPEENTSDLLKITPLTDAKKTEWATYRQGLRDVPSKLSEVQTQFDANKDNTTDQADDGQIYPLPPS